MSVRSISTDTKKQSPISSSQTAVTSQNKGQPTLQGELMTACTEPAKLIRLSSLEKILPPAIGWQKKRRLEVLASLTSIWTDVVKESNPSDALEGAQKSLKSLTGRFLAKAAQIYITELNKLSTTGKVNSIFDKAKVFLEDVTAVAFTSPMKKATEGQMGPTLIVSYPLRTSDPQVKMVESVIKWETPEGVASQRIYSAFSKLFGESGGIFSTPRQATLDFEKSTYESRSGTLVKLTEDLLRPAGLSSAKELQDRYTLLAKTADPKLEPRLKQITSADFVKGKDLLDFAYSKNGYADLTAEARKKFFNRLGRIAMIDLVLGNSDRLICFSHDEEGSKYFLSNDSEVNLGNVMVSNESSRELFAIDNGLDVDLIKDGNKRKAYITFLTKLFQEEKPYSKLTENIVKCYISSLYSNADNVDNLKVDDITKHKSVEEKNTPEKKPIYTLVKLAMKPLIRDLGTPKYQTELNSGMINTAKWLKGDFAQNIWNKNTTNKTALALKDYLAKNYKELLTAINERIDCFTKIETKETIKELDAAECKQ